ncbi:MAG: hypothetical protein V3T55_01235 [Anaerolineales bacterium]
MVKLLTLPLPWSTVQPLLRRALEEVGLVAVQSFDLQSARESLLAPERCPCPYHGTSQCTCQYIVYIVRQEGQPPISLEVHGYDDRTQVSLAPPSDGIIDESTMNLVRLALDQLARVHDPPSV